MQYLNVPGLNDSLTRLVNMLISRLEIAIDQSRENPEGLVHLKQALMCAQRVRAVIQDDDLDPETVRTVLRTVKFTLDLLNK